MSKSEDFSVNGSNRAQYRAYRASLLLADLNAPVPDPTNPLLPALTTTGPQYLPFSYKDRPLKFMIPTFDRHNDPVPTVVTIRMTVDGTEDDVQYKYDEETPLDPPPPIPMTLHLARKDLPGLRRISYTFDFGGNTPNVNSLEYMVDFAAPVLDTFIAVPQSVRDYGIGPEDFDSGATVLLTYPDYSNKRLGDTIKCYIGPDRTVNREVGSITLDEGNFGNPIVFNLTAAHVVGYNSKCIVFCEAVSYPGVPAVPSGNTDVWVSQERRPVVAEPLDVPQAPTPTSTLLIDHLVDGVGAGLKVVFPNFNNTLDEIEYSIDDVVQPPKNITTIPFLNTLDNQALLQRGHGRRQVKLGYRIKRGNFYFPVAPIDTLVWLDVRKPAAPFDPANPDPPDVTLLQPWIQGPVSTDKNKLTAADKQNGGVVKGYLPFHTLFKKGDKATFYINGREAPAPGGVWTFPTDDSEDPTKPIEFEFKWEWLGSIPDDVDANLQCIVEHDLNANLAISPVDYAEIKTQPIVLTAAGFRHMDADPRKGFICNSLRKLASNEIVGVVHIPADTRLEGNEITLTYGGYSTSAAAPADLIAGTEVELKHTPTKAEAANGFDMYVPYTHLQTTLNAYGRTDYFVIIEKEDVDTKGVVVRVNMSEGTGTCNLIPVIPV
ncbi:hypothetical protein ABIA48_001458 [Pseudomonas sp. S30_BP2TU TE3576]|uniref:hypothetical protein n=1 Tax=Pseudomonas sp. S30_BP2TU TE3576 TaxID=3349329 RepID=UPI003D1B35AC